MKGHANQGQVFATFNVMWRGRNKIRVPIVGIYRLRWRNIFIKNPVILKKEILVKFKFRERVQPLRTQRRRNIIGIRKPNWPPEWEVKLGEKSAALVGLGVGSCWGGGSAAGLSEPDPGATSSALAKATAGGKFSPPAAFCSATGSPGPVSVVKYGEPNADDVRDPRCGKNLCFPKMAPLGLARMPHQETSKRRPPCW